MTYMRVLEQIAPLEAGEFALLMQAKQVIRSFLPTAEVLLYGSSARGDREPDSDYDLLVLTAQSVSRQEARRVDDALYDLELDSGAVLSTLYQCQDTWKRVSGMPFHAEVEKDAIRL